MRTLAYSITVGILIVCFSAPLQAADSRDTEIQLLKAQIQALEKRVQALEELVKPLRGEMQSRGRQLTLREKFNARIELDRKTYSPQQLREIETLYQSANKQLEDPQAKESLKKLVEQYPKANRTGCAVLYLGQMTQGEEGNKYLLQAIKEFPDCFYGDGVQVGAYARYILVDRYTKSGKNAEASQMIQEIKTNYPDAVDHSGNKLNSLLERK